MTVELSTAGLRKPIDEIYPSRELCEMCIDAGAVFALSSDAHAPDYVGYEYGRAVDLLRELGVRRSGCSRIASDEWRRSG